MMTHRVAAVPFRHGELDRLCGLYAIVNAMRRALPCPALATDDWRAVFDALVLYADDEVGAATMLIDGIGSKPFGKLLQRAARHVADNHGFELAVARPLIGIGKPPIADVLDRLGAMAAQPGSAVIIGFRERHRRWAVIERVEPRYLVLCDGARHCRRRRANCRMRYEVALPARCEHVLTWKAVVAVSFH